MVFQFRENTINHLNVNFTWVNFMVCELYLPKLLMNSM